MIIIMTILNNFWSNNSTYPSILEDMRLYRELSGRQFANRTSSVEFRPQQTSRSGNTEMKPEKYRMLQLQEILFQLYHLERIRRYELSGTLVQGVRICSA